MRFVKGLSLALGAWFALAAAFAGCTCVINNYNYYTRPAPVFVAKAPPAPVAETQPPAPSGDHVWIAGYWEWSESEEEWVWIGGVWTIPPDDGATWVAPEYDENNGDWVYVPGGWTWNTPGGAAADDEAWTPTLPPVDLHWGGQGGDTGPKDGGPKDAGPKDAGPKEEALAPEAKLPPGASTPVEPAPAITEVAVPPHSDTVAPEDDPYADDNGSAAEGKKHKKKHKAEEPKAERPTGDGEGGGVEPKTPAGDLEKPDARTDDDAPKHKLKKKPPKPEEAAKDAEGPRSAPDGAAKDEPKVRVRDRAVPKAQR